MKKWFSIAKIPCLLGGGVILGATTDLGIIHMLAMALLMSGGVFLGLEISEEN